MNKIVAPETKAVDESGKAMPLESLLTARQRAEIVR